MRLSRALDEGASRRFDNWMHDRIERFAIFFRRKDNCAKRATIELAVPFQHACAPTRHDLGERRSFRLYCFAGENVSIDEKSSPLDQLPRNGRFPAGDVPREPDSQHDLGAR